MAKTLAQQLEDVEDAITRAEAAQSATSGDGRQRVNPNLAVLYDRRDALERRIRRESDGSVFIGQV
ncbi:MAG: hypothetical protein JXA69_14675 [Phycisphaerae bacterium]|nr:hypothetical protein [Phycisphaerae bacterium]